MSELTNAFFEDLAMAEDQAVEGVREALLNEAVPAWVSSETAVPLLREVLRTPEQIDALATFVREMVHAALHTALVSLDGGAASADVGRLDLVDGDGNSLGDGLHERYVEYLLDTGRMA